MSTIHYVTVTFEVDGSEVVNADPVETVAEKLKYQPFPYTMSKYQKRVEENDFGSEVTESWIIR